MNRIILIKTCNEIQLGHLYEHLYLSAVLDLFKRHKLLAYLDYDWYGQTHFAGSIYIYVALATPEAKVLAAKIRTIKPDFSWESISGATAAIIAEEKKHLGANEKLLQKALNELHAQPWQTIDDFTYVDSRRVRRSRTIIWDSDRVARTKMLKSEFIFANDFAQQNRILLPLFRSVTKTLEDNIIHNLAKEFDYYRYAGSAVYNTKVAKEITNYRVLIHDFDRLENELEIYKTSIKWALEQNFIGKMVSFMQNRRTPGEVLIGPDEVDVYEACEVFMGDAGWRQIATEENIREILKHTTLQLTFGREKQSFEVAELLG